MRDFRSGFVKVQNREITDPVFFQIEDIVRKVILYKSGDDLNVADFQRQSQSLRYTVIVPVYPQNGDMLLIQRHARNVVPWDSILGIAEGL